MEKIVIEIVPNEQEYDRESVEEWLMMKLCDGIDQEIIESWEIKYE